MPKTLCLSQILNDAKSKISLSNPVTPTIEKTVGYCRRSFAIPQLQNYEWGKILSSVVYKGLGYNESGNCCCYCRRISCDTYRRYYKSLTKRSQLKFEERKLKESYYTNYVKAISNNVLMKDEHAELDDAQNCLILVGSVEVVRILMQFHDAIKLSAPFAARNTIKYLLT